MHMTIKRLVDRWGRSIGSDDPDDHRQCGNVRIEGRDLYSYNECIARILPWRLNHRPLVWVSTKRWSMSTSRHQARAADVAASSISALVISSEARPYSLAAIERMVESARLYDKFFGASRPDPRELRPDSHERLLGVLQAHVPTLPNTFHLLTAQYVANKFFDKAKLGARPVVLQAENCCTHVMGYDSNSSLLNVPYADNAQTQWFQFAHMLADTISDRGGHGTLWEKRMAKIVTRINKEMGKC